MPETVVIDRRFRGPPDSGNGGYVCGVVAGYLDGDAEAEVTLRRPTPLDTPLDLVSRDGHVQLRHGDTLIAEAAPAALDLEPRDGVSYEQAVEASKRYAGHRAHIFPGCFVCGPGRDDDRGLRIFPGPIEGGDTVAAPWTPDASLADDNHLVRPEFVWASLDCPGAWSLFASGERRESGRPVVLGRLAARLLAPVGAGDRCVIVAWPLGEEGRKLYAGSALYREGELAACARATWVRLD